jgi:hypothetical protein
VLLFPLPLRRLDIVRILVSRFGRKFKIANPDLPPFYVLVREEAEEF